MRAFLEAAGYTAVPGKHQHLKLRHPARPPVLRPIGAAFVAAVTAQDRPPAAHPARDA